jgi:Ca-activated chloride channel family protein
MKFLWQDMLWLLLLLPLLVGFYFLIVRRKRRAALRYANLSMVKDAMRAGQRWRRHIPPLLFFVALALMLIAIARPAAKVTLPSDNKTVILAMDVSGSMRAADVQPSRIEAAQAAARAFVADQPYNTRSASSRLQPRRPSCSRRRNRATISWPPSIASSCSAARRSEAASWCR